MRRLVDYCRSFMQHFLAPNNDRPVMLPVERHAFPQQPRLNVVANQLRDQSAASGDPRQIRLELHVPAHRVTAVTEELNLRIQGVLLKAMREDHTPDERSMLVFMGVRGDGAVAPTSSLFH